jgi:hypothetical protein
VFSGSGLNGARVCLRCWGGRGIHRIDRIERIRGPGINGTRVCVCGGGEGVEFSEMVGIKRTERIWELAVIGARLCLEWRGGRDIKRIQRIRRIQRIVGFVINSARVCWRSWGGRGIRRITRNERVWGVCRK